MVIRRSSTKRKKIENEGTKFETNQSACGTKTPPSQMKDESMFLNPLILRRDKSKTDFQIFKADIDNRLKAGKHEIPKEEKKDILKRRSSYDITNKVVVASQPLSLSPIVTNGCSEEESSIKTIDKEVSLV